MPVEQYFNYGEQKGGLEDGKLELVVVGLEVVFDSDIDRFRAVVIEELSVVVFRDSDSGSVTRFSESIDSFASDYFRDSTEHRIGIAVVFAIEDFAEDIELFDWGIESDGDIFEVSPRIDEVFESILIEVEALDTHIRAVASEDVVVGDDAFDGSAAWGMRGIGKERLREGFLFRSGGAAGL